MKHVEYFLIGVGTVLFSPILVLCLFFYQSYKIGEDIYQVIHGGGR